MEGRRWRGGDGGGGIIPSGCFFLAAVETGATSVTAVV